MLQRIVKSNLTNNKTIWHCPNTNNQSIHDALCSKRPKTAIKMNKLLITLNIQGKHALQLKVRKKHSSKC